MVFRQLGLVQFSSCDHSAKKQTKSAVFFWTTNITQLYFLLVQVAWFPDLLTHQEFCWCLVGEIGPVEVFSHYSILYFTTAWDSLFWIRGVKIVWLKALEKIKKVFQNQGQEDKKETMLEGRSRASGVFSPQYLMKYWFKKPWCDMPGLISQYSKLFGHLLWRTKPKRSI